MPQLSRRTFNAANRYETVVFCEGTKPADFEMVELQDYQNSERSALQEILLTDGALGTGFLAVGSGLSNAVSLTLGAALSQGQRLLLPDVLHPAIGSSFIYAMPTATPVADRVDLIYLSVGVSDVTGVQDPNIEDPTLGPSAYREQVTYQILLAQGLSIIPTLPQGIWGFPIATVQRYAGQAAVNAADVTDARLIANLSDNLSPGNLITVSATGGQFNSVANALASIPASGPGASSQSNPYVVLVYPGQYVSNVPIVLSNPYVTLIGLDPATTSIMVTCTGGSAFTVSANSVTIANLGLDLGVASTGNNTVLTVSASVSAASVENCVIGAQAYAASPTSTFSGVFVGAGSSLTINSTSVWAENYGAGLTLLSSTSSVSAESLSITAMGADAIDNAGSLTLMYSTILSNMHSLNSSGPAVDATDTSFATATVGGNAATGVEGMLLSGPAVITMEECSIASTINQVTVTNVTLLWDGVSVGAFVVLSGIAITYASTFSDCLLTGISIAKVTATFTSCTVSGGSNTVSGGLVVGFYVSSSAAVSIVGCNNTGSNAVTVVGASPIISNCSFQSVGAGVSIIAISGGANPLISNCTFVEFVTAGVIGAVNSNAIYVADVVSNPVITYCFFVGLPPLYFVNGIAGSTITVGDNMASAISAPPSLYDTGNITIVSLETSVSGVITEVEAARGTAATLGARLGASMNPAGFILSIGLDALRPFASTVPDDNVHISVGTYINSTGTADVTVTGAPGAPFVSVNGPNTNYRIDLLVLNDSGTLSAITNGTLNVAAAAYPSGYLVVAEVTCKANGDNSPPIISAADVKDVRPFLRSFSSNAATATLATSATAATNIAGGAAGKVPYQSGADTTAFTAAGTTGQSMLSGGTGSPTWGTPAVATSATELNGVAITNAPSASVPQTLVSADATHAAWATPATPPVSVQTVTDNALDLSGTPHIYQNTGPGPKMVAVSVSCPNAVTLQVMCDSGSSPSTVIASIGNADSGSIQASDDYIQLFFIVLPGYYYKVRDVSGGGATLLYWTEWA